MGEKLVAACTPKVIGSSWSFAITCESGKFD